jgi:hypothetical protein
MKKIIMLCVGVLGVAGQSSFAAGNAGYGIAAGGCYGQPEYRSPVAQNVPYNYPAGSANCVNGRCAPIGSVNYSQGQYGPLSYSAGAADCPNGQCPLNHTAGTADYTTGQYRPVDYTSGNLDGRDGQCRLKGNQDWNAGNQYGANRRRPTTGNHYPQTTNSRYNQYPDTRFGTDSYPQSRSNPYSARPAYDVNWTNTNRSVQPSSYPNSTSPFFN